MKMIFINTKYLTTSDGILATEFKNLLVNELYLKKINTIYNGDKNIVAHFINYFNKILNRTSIILDICFNFGYPVDNGTEAIIDNNNEKNLAIQLSNSVAETLMIPFNGVNLYINSHISSRKDGWKLRGRNILMKICFITNKNEMIKYHKNKFSLAEKITDILVKNI